MCTERKATGEYVLACLMLGQCEMSRCNTLAENLRKILGENRLKVRNLTIII